MGAPIWAHQCHEHEQRVTTMASALDMHCEVFICLSSAGGATESHCLDFFCQVMSHTWKVGPLMLLFSAAAAFALNCAIFLLVGKTSALTLNVAGVVKDVVLVYLSVAVYG